MWFWLKRGCDFHTCCCSESNALEFTQKTRNPRKHLRNPPESPGIPCGIPAESPATLAESPVLWVLICARFYGCFFFFGKEARSVNLCYNEGPSLESLLKAVALSCMQVLYTLWQPVAETLNIKVLVDVSKYKRP